jgi:hypothetical protein
VSNSLHCSLIPREGPVISVNDSERALLLRGLFGGERPAVSPRKIARYQNVYSPRRRRSPMFCVASIQAMANGAYAML